jgi:hypothetical protein
MPTIFEEPIKYFWAMVQQQSKGYIKHKEFEHTAKRIHEENQKVHNSWEI